MCLGYKRVDKPLLGTSLTWQEPVQDRYHPECISSQDSGRPQMYTNKQSSSLAPGIPTELTAVSCHFSKAVPVTLP